MSPVLSDEGRGVASVWERLLTGGPHDSADTLPKEASLGPAPSLGELVTDTVSEILDNHIAGGWLVVEGVTGVLQAMRRRRAHGQSARGSTGHVVDERTSAADRVQRPTHQAAVNGLRLDPAGPV